MGFYVMEDVDSVVDVLDPILVAFGERKSLHEWAKDRRSMVTHLTLAARIDAGWEVERALTTPPVRNRRHHEKPLMAFGECKSLLEWAADPRAMAPARTILWRVRRGWKPEDAITFAVHVPSAREKTTATPPKLYEAFGTQNTLRGWLEDSRCQVKREKLLRNLSQGMGMEEALTTGGFDGRRTKNRAMMERPVESLDEALELLSRGAELWHVQNHGQCRSSLLRGNTRYDMSSELLEALQERGYVDLTFETPTISEYALTDSGRAAIAK